MPGKKYRIRLDFHERAALEAVICNEPVAGTKTRKATALLLGDENGPTGPLSDERIAAQTGLSAASLSRLRRRYSETGPLQAVERKLRESPPVEPVIRGELEARLIAEACSPPPPGRDRWTLRLLARRLVELDLVESISHETVRASLKRASFNLGTPTGRGAPRGPAPPPS